MLDGAKAKIARARQHSVSLANAFEEFKSSGGFGGVISQARDSETQSLSFGQVKDAPIEILCILGDAVHNLRAALDLMAWAAVEASGFRPTKTTCMPFAKDAKNIKGELKKAGLDTLPEAAQEYIVDVMQTYEGGAGNLYRLHRADILDKHQLIIPVLYVPSSSVNMSVIGDTDNEKKIIAHAYGASSINIPGTITSSTIEASVTFKFSDDCPIDGEVLEALKTFEELVQTHVIAMEELIV